MLSPGLPFADWARSSELLLKGSLAHPGPLTLAVVFSGGLLTSLGPCSLSLLPVTLAYLAGFGAEDQGHAPWQRSVSFAAGIVAALVLLGLASGLMGRLYGRIPGQLPLLVAVVAVVMGLNLLGVLRLPLPAGPDPERWRRRVPAPLAGRWPVRPGHPAFRRSRPHSRRRRLPPPWRSLRSAGRPGTWRSWWLGTRPRGRKQSARWGARRG
jgi:cytochrome c-type biogenesis protein